MRNPLTPHLAALALLMSGLLHQAHAQTIQGYINQPPVSPYLNILRGGAPAGVNYYNLVQPQLQFYSAINQLQVQQQQQGVLSTNAAGALITGHPIQFSNLSHYYPPTGFGIRGGAGGSGSSVTPAIPALAQSNAPIRNLGVAPVGQPGRKR